MISPSPTSLYIKIPGCSQSGSHHPHSPSGTKAAVQHQPSQQVNTEIGTKRA
ncbi:hypothetical protein SLEP1_g41426 [Rubroshorea leprosula]|uniref:Uncharacterized protein n=1 Tax=Rubroshorea leprosula TaxID=152421 RepID=A0AAV5L7G8_9ROSI|nr:hypothetical protein SLEP1_g41426 [Rubroshorea leprosula]